MNAKRGLIVAVAAVMAGGCMRPSAEMPLPASRGLAGEFGAYQAPIEPPKVGAAEVAVEEPAGAITLRQALALALMRNPELAGASWDVRAAEARQLQAGLLPNPELEIEAENIGGSGEFRGFRSSETTIALGQLIELGGKRMKRTRLAALERDLAGWDYEARRIDVYAETTRAFVDLLAAQQKVKLAEDLLAISQRVFDTAAERVRAGRSAPLEQHKAQVALGSGKLQLEQAKREMQALRQQLAATWGATQVRFTQAEGEFEAVTAIPTEEQLAGLVSRNPDIARWKTEMEQRQAALTLEKAKAIPDLTVRGGVRRLAESDDTAFVVGVSIPLPVFDRNQGGIRESLYQLAKASAQRRAAEAKARSNLAAAYQVMAAAFAEVTILKEDILPAAKQAFDAANEGYRQGKFAYLEVLDAQRTLYEANGQHVDALAEYHKAVADVERLTGESLTKIRSDKHVQ